MGSAISSHAALIAALALQDGRSCLDLAVANNHNEVVSLLLERKADVTGLLVRAGQPSSPGQVLIVLPIRSCVGSSELLPRSSTAVFPAAACVLCL